MLTNRALTLWIAGYCWPSWIDLLVAVGLDALAASIGEARGTIEDVLEPYLIQQGYLMRTPVVGGNR